MSKAGFIGSGLRSMNNQDNANQRSTLEAKIRKIDEQITILNGLKNQCLTKLQSLPREAVPQQTTLVNSRSLDDKILLFKSYFRGRDDVYAKLWVNNRTGKRGYRPSLQT
jgi:hypothetical protein